jgi:hypothetical protein
MVIALYHFPIYPQEEDFQTLRGDGGSWRKAGDMALHTGSNILTATVAISSGPAGLIAGFDLDF